MGFSTEFLWAKTDGQVSGKWHPLILHMLDVAACADAILGREPKATRNRFGAVLGGQWDEARAWILVLAAAHDLGKCCPGFQCKWPDLSPNTGLPLPRCPNTRINHAFVSQIALMEALIEKGWPEELSDLAADAVGCHHGERANPALLDTLGGDRSARGDRAWDKARGYLLDAVIETLGAGDPPRKHTLSGPDFMLLAGLTSFTDWIGSNEEWFSFGKPEDCNDLKGWLENRRLKANQALDAIGWHRRKPLSAKHTSFRDVFNLNPRPLQETVENLLPDITGPAVLLIEAPMGEGKTEAAFYAHLELQRRLGHRGLYVALPTKATGNAMFMRTLGFLSGQRKERVLDLQLVHGGTLLNDAFQDLRFSGVHDTESGGGIRAGEWFTQKKRALLSEYGVGTVDQALLPILPVRHQFVRLWGLANRVVIFDEIHAYDAYTGTLLVHLLKWLLALGSSIVLLSATLPPSIRRKIADAVNSGMPEIESPYPRLTCFHSGTVSQIHFMPDPKRRREIRLGGIPEDLPSVYSAIVQRLFEGGLGLALMNTVQRAQDLYRLFPEGEPMASKGHRVGKRLADGTEIYLFHARFPADRRQVREDRVLAVFGNDADRKGRKILIATQVAEQSLDLDFDVMVTDLAPIDLVLQRAGRLWRHEVSHRAVPVPMLLISGLVGESPSSFEKPLWWSSVYREDVLLRTWCLLKGRDILHLPEEIDDLVKAVYEEEIDVTDSIRARLEKALENNDGDAFALSIQAHQAIIGLPDDASWNDPTRFVLFDDDAPGVHRTLMARTRIGRESVLSIPLSVEDGFREDQTPGFPTAKDWYGRAVSLSRTHVVRTMRTIGVPDGWHQSPLLRNCYPLTLDDDGRWIEDPSARLDDELGIVYEPKEAQ
ncbi:MAG: CRISPR-associated helicase Cas3' [Pseudomonadota bacterium]